MRMMHLHQARGASVRQDVIVFEQLAGDLAGRAVLRTRFVGRPGEAA